jgi:hypothetical protein
MSEEVLVDKEQLRQEAVNKRLESIAWALFLIMIGGLWLVPDNVLPEGVWSIGVGLILLGLNAARWRSNIRMSGFTLFVGGLALLTGIGDMAGIDLPVFALILIFIGASMIVKPLLEKDRLPS